MSKIVQLSEAASLGIHAMVIIAQSDSIVNANYISEVTNCSRNHLAKVMLVLVKVGAVKSVRGPSGGFVLGKKPEEITLLDIYEAIEGKINISQCPNDKQVCPFNKCLLNNILHKVTYEIIDYFKSNTLKDLI